MKSGIQKECIVQLHESEVSTNQQLIYSSPKWRLSLHILQYLYVCLLIEARGDEHDNILS